MKTLPEPAPFRRRAMRARQDRFDSRRLADRPQERLGKSVFGAGDRAFIASRAFFFLAADDGGGAAAQPDSSASSSAP